MEINKETRKDKIYRLLDMVGTIPPAIDVVYEDIEAIFTSELTLQKEAIVEMLKKEIDCDQAGLMERTIDFASYLEGIDKAIELIRLMK